MNTLQGLLIPANFWEPLLSLDHSLSSPQLLKSFSPFVPLSINPPPPVPLPQAVLLVSQSLQKFLTGTQSSPWLGDQEHTFRWWSMKKHPKCASLTRVISCFLQVWWLGLSHGFYISLLPSCALHYNRLLLLALAQHMPLQEGAWLIPAF